MLSLSTLSSTGEAYPEIQSEKPYGKHSYHPNRILQQFAKPNIRYSAKASKRREGASGAEGY